MNITPNEISNKEFKKVFRGYDIDEVDEFLDQLVEDYEKIYKENINLKESIVGLEDKISHYSNIEATLQNTLLLAQTTADQVKENSKKEIEILIKDANDNAANIIRKAEDRVMDINKEYERIKQDYMTFKTRFKALLEAQVESLTNTDIEVRE